MGERTQAASFTGIRGRRGRSAHQTPAHLAIDEVRGRNGFFLLIRPVRGVLMYALPYSLLGALRMGVHLNPPPQR